MSQPFLQATGPLIVTKAVKWQCFFPGLGEAWLTEAAEKPALSLHVLILSASTSLDFLSFSALTSPLSPAPLGCFVSMSLSVRSLSATQGNRKTRPEHAAPDPPAPRTARQGSEGPTGHVQHKATHTPVQLSGGQSRG